MNQWLELNLINQWLELLDGWTWARIHQGVVYNCEQCIVMQMLEWVLGSPLNACCKFTLFYRCNDSEMGQPSLWRELVDSGSCTSAQNSERKLRLESVQSTFLRAPGNSDRFEGGISYWYTHRHISTQTSPSRPVWSWSPPWCARRQWWGRPPPRGSPTPAEDTGDPGD